MRVPGVGESIRRLSILSPLPVRGLVCSERGTGLRRPVSRNVASERPGHEAGLDLAGIGWGRLPLWSVERDLADGRLVRIAATGLGRQGETIMDAYLAHRTEEPLGPAASALRCALFRHVDQAP